MMQFSKKFACPRTIPQDVHDLLPQMYETWCDTLEDPYNEHKKVGFLRFLPVLLRCISMMI